MNLGFMVRLLCSLLFAIAIGVMSGYQLIGLSRDFENYFEFFEIVRESVNYWDINYRFEPGFTALIYGLTRAGFDNYLIYSIVAGLVIFVKYFSIEFSDKYWAVLSIFTFYLVCRYIVLFEMTVLRAACAFALAFYVFYRKSNDSINWVNFFILCAAIAFHYSAIVFVLIYFLRPVNLRRIILVAVGVFFVVYFAKKIAFIYFPEYISFFSNYEDFGKATFLPVPFAIDILFLIFVALKFEAADVSMRYAVMGMALSVAFHFSLIDYVIFASRFRELLSVFFLIYVVRAVYCDDDNVRYVSVIYVLLSGLMHLYVYFIHDPLLL